MAPNLIGRTAGGSSNKIELMAEAALLAGLHSQEDYQDFKAKCEKNKKKTFGDLKALLSDAEKKAKKRITVEKERVDGYFGQLGSPKVFPSGTRLIMDDIYDMEHETFYKQHAQTLGTIDHYDKIMNMYIVNISAPKSMKEIRRLRRDLEKEMPPVYRVILVGKRSIVMFSLRRPKFRKDI